MSDQDDDAAAWIAHRDARKVEMERLTDALAAMTQERDALDLRWEAASLFIRDVIDACGQQQPAPDGFVDLSSLRLIVVGQIEEYKSRTTAAEASLAALHQGVQQIEQDVRTQTSQWTSVRVKAWAGGIADRLVALLTASSE